MKMKYRKLYKRFCYPLLFLLILLIPFCNIHAQSGYWQQRVKYSMDIDMNVMSNRFAGKQQLAYTNNSPDTLRKVFYHLFWNAFQPNSMMDKKSQAWGENMINGKKDWDRRVMDRIQKLKPDETGFQKIISLKMDGVTQPF